MSAREVHAGNGHGRRYLVGVDVGSTTVKAVAVDAATDEMIWSDYQRHETKQPEKTLEFLGRLEAALGINGSNTRMFITGSGGATIAPLVGAKFVQEVTAVSLAVEKLQALALKLARYEPNGGGNGGLLSFFRKKRNEEPPQGLYLYGGVGRGTRCGSRSSAGGFEDGVLLLPLAGERLLLFEQPSRLRFERSQPANDILQLLREPRPFGFEVGDDARVHELPVVALHRPAALGDHVGQPASPLTQLLDAHERVAHVVVAPR